MTKEEKIKEAWGLNYDEFSEYIDSDGWARYPHFQKHEMVQDVRPIEFRSQGTDFRPKSLQGIENNNGWIKIESEDDLPKELYIKTNIIKDNKTYMYCDYRGNNIWWNYEYKILIENATHYRPIEKPNPPIY